MQAKLSVTKHAPDPRAVLCATCRHPLSAHPERQVMLGFHRPTQHPCDFNGCQCTEFQR